MAALQPKRSSSPEDLGDIEKGVSVFKPTETPIQVVTHQTAATPAPKKELTGEEVLAKAIGPGVYRGRGPKKSRKHKKRVHKKTQKRRVKK